MITNVVVKEIIMFQRIKTGHKIIKEKITVNMIKTMIKYHTKKSNKILK